MLETKLEEIMKLISKVLEVQFLERSKLVYVSFEA